MHLVDCTGGGEQSWGRNAPSSVCSRPWFQPAQSIPPFPCSLSHSFPHTMDDCGYQNQAGFSFTTVSFEAIHPKSSRKSIRCLLHQLSESWWKQQGNISGLDPAVPLVSRWECEFPRTFIADGPLFLAPVVH